MTDRIRVAVAGLGAVAQAVHLPLLARRWDLYQVAAVCDLSPSLRDEVGQQYGVAAAHRYADVHDMLASADVDGVLLLTSGSHGPAALQALRQRTAVFCEKPLAYTTAEADQLAAAQAAAGRTLLLLGYMKERDEAVVRLRERLAATDGVRAVEVRVLHPSSVSQQLVANLRPAGDLPAGAPALGSAPESALLDTALGAGGPDWLRSLYGGPVLSSLIHNTALLRALFGGLARVDDVRVWPDGDGDRSVEVSGTLPGGARARMSWHYLPDYPAYRETLAVHHARGSLAVTFASPYLLNAPTELEVVEPAPGGEVRATYRSTGEAFEAELVEFHRMVTGGTPPVAGIAEGRADIVTSQRIVRRLAEQRGIAIGGEAAGA